MRSIRHIACVISGGAREIRMTTGSWWGKWNRTKSPKVPFYSRGTRLPIVKTKQEVKQIPTIRLMKTIIVRMPTNGSWIPVTQRIISMQNCSNPFDSQWAQLANLIPVSETSSKKGFLSVGPSNCSITITGKLCQIMKCRGNNFFHLSHRTRILFQCVYIYVGKNKRPTVVARRKGFQRPGHSANLGRHIQVTSFKPTRRHTQGFCSFFFGGGKMSLG